MRTIMLAIVAAVVSGCIPSYPTSRPSSYYCSEPRTVAVHRISGLLAELGYTITLVSAEAGIVQARMELPDHSRSWRVSITDSVRIFPALSVHASTYVTDVRDRPINLNRFDSVVMSWVVTFADRVNALCPTTDASGVSSPH